MRVAIPLVMPPDAAVTTAAFTAWAAEHHVTRWNITYDDRWSMGITVDPDSDDGERVAQLVPWDSKPRLTGRAPAHSPIVWSVSGRAFGVRFTVHAWATEQQLADLMAAATAAAANPTTGSYDGPEL